MIGALPLVFTFMGLAVMTASVARQTSASLALVMGVLAHAFFAAIALLHVAYFLHVGSKLLDIGSSKEGALLASSFVKFKASSELVLVSALVVRPLFAARAVASVYGLATLQRRVRLTTVLEATATVVASYVFMRQIPKSEAEMLSVCDTVLRSDDDVVSPWDRARLLDAFDAVEAWSLAELAACLVGVLCAFVAASAETTAAREREVVARSAHPLSQKRTVMTTTTTALIGEDASASTRKRLEFADEGDITAIEEEWVVVEAAHAVPHDGAIVEADDEDDNVRRGAPPAVAGAPADDEKCDEALEASATVAYSFRDLTIFNVVKALGKFGLAFIVLAVLRRRILGRPE